MKLETQFLNSWQLLKSRFSNLILGIFFIIALIFAVSILEYGLFYLLVYLKLAAVSALAFNAGFRAVYYIFYLILGVIAQIVLINIFLNPELNFGQNLKTLKTFFWQMLILNVAVSLIFFIASSPLYANVLLLLLGNPVLFYASTILGYILILLAVSFLVFSPFVLMDKKLNWLDSIKKSFAIARINLTQTIFNLVILAIIFTALNLVSLLYLNILPWTLIINGLLVLFLIMFTFAYLFAMYKNFKQ
ncbi:MAG: hypothetical protein PHC97_04615 [Patescibacteria group bacterium]|nr:hypothetical protein [Patescibacteria group bacterium]